MFLPSSDAVYSRSVRYITIEMRQADAIKGVFVKELEEG
jgi:hypothetical protein